MSLANVVTGPDKYTATGKCYSLKYQQVITSLGLSGAKISCITSSESLQPATPFVG